MDLGFRCKGNHIIAEFLYQFRRAINIKTEKQEAPKKKRKIVGLSHIRLLNAALKTAQGKVGRKFM